MEFSTLIRTATVTLGLDAAILLFNKLRLRASQLRICPWPPTPSDLALVFLSFIELLGLAVESAPRCANCHDTEHSTATCPHFPASFTHDAALGYLPPPTTAGTSGSGKKGTKRQRPSRSNKSNKPAAAAGAAPPSGARPCRFGVNCRNKLTTCKFTH